MLVGTVSVEKSERLSRLLGKRGIQHAVLNAKQHEREAVIVAQAGRLHSVTVATNMAGRGVDIILGGNAEGLASLDTLAEGLLLDTAEGKARFEELFKQYKDECSAEGDKIRDLGGLYVLGTERHESRRIDNQLRGRSGRQGDPGESRFYLSLEDELMRLFATGAMSWVMGKALPDDVPIEAKMVTRAIEKAQGTVEARNAEIRKDVLKYDEVMNEQRKVVYRRRQTDPRRGRPAGRGPHPPHQGHRAPGGRVLLHRLRRGLEPRRPPPRHRHLLPHRLHRRRAGRRPPARPRSGRACWPRPCATTSSGRSSWAPTTMREIERRVMLSILDQRWREHLYEMDYLQEGINLRAMGQKDPLSEWQREGYDMFGQMIDAISDDFVRYVMHLEVVVENAAPARGRQRAAVGPRRPVVGVGRRQAGGGPGGGRRRRGRRGAAGGGAPSTTRPPWPRW